MEKTKNMFDAGEEKTENFIEKGSGRNDDPGKWQSLFGTGMKQEARKRAGVVKAQKTGGAGYVIPLRKGKERLDLS